MQGSGNVRTDLMNVERWTILGLSCVVLFGQSFCYDIPASVHDHLLSYSGLGDDSFPWYFNAMYSAYSLPNLVLPLAFGLILDKTTACTIIFSLSIVACVGQLIVSVGVIRHTPGLMIAGRFLFGLGCESLAVAVNAMLTHAFDGKEIAFSLALNVSSARLGTISNNWISPVISTLWGIPMAFFFGLFLSFLSSVAAYRLSCLASTTNFRDKALDLRVRQPARIPRLLFWAVAAVCVGGYCSILPFTSVFVAMKPKSLSQEQASQVVSISFLISALLTPVLGRFVDRFGRAAWIASSSIFLLCLTHAMYSSYHHSLVMVVLGLAYSGFVASIWPLVPLTVDEANVGFAYGIMTSLQNMGLTVVPLMIAAIRFHTGSYADTRWLFLFLSSLTLAVSTWLASELSFRHKSFEVITDPEIESLSKNNRKERYCRFIDE